MGAAAATCGSGVRSLEQRVAELEAVAAIQALKYRYWRACDAKDPAGFRECFIARGAEIDFERMGQFTDADAIAEVFRRVALRTDGAGQPLVLDMHHGMHPDIIVLDATTAAGTWTLRFRQLDLTARTEKVAAIEYDDTYTLEHGTWRMSSSRARTRWSLTRPLADDVMFDIAVGVPGGAGA